MNAHDTIYSLLEANGGEISGRTAIQKLVYLSSEKIPELDVPPYKPHYFGPFSPGLMLVLEKMLSYSFLYEYKNPNNTYRGYTYSLTRDGQEIAKDVRET